MARPGTPKARPQSQATQKHNPSGAFVVIKQLEMDIKVDNLAHSARSELVADNCWDNTTEFVVPLAS